MAYKEKAGLPVAEGGTGQITLTQHGVLVGNATSGITQLSVASTGQTLMGSTGADPSFTGSPSFSGSVTAGTFLTASSGNITATSGNLVIPVTSSSVGKVVQNGVDFIHTFGSDNLFIGTSSGKAGNYTLTGTDNIAIGANVMQNLTSGSLNFGIGTNTLNALTSGQNNVGYGIACLQGVTTANQNIAIGNNSTRYTTGSNNIGIGYQAYQGAVGTTTGSSNICIGTQAGSAYTGAESGNIVIGSTVAGTLGESNVLRIGGGTGTGNGQINKALISGIFGITVGASGIGVFVDNANQLGTVVSSIRYKKDIEDLDGTYIIYNLKPRKFTYKSNNIPAWGLIAEEVQEVFPALVAYNQEGWPESVRYHDLPVLLLAEIQKLRKEIDELKRR